MRNAMTWQGQTASFTSQGVVPTTTPCHGDHCGLEMGRYFLIRITPTATDLRSRSDSFQIRRFDAGLRSSLRS